ncbi:MAG: very short patch repair endonuclease [Kiloniellales bacterium]
MPGKPDIVFRSRKSVIFVHGCFWHQHSHPRCPLRSRPRTNTGYWNAKLERNVERDTENRALLYELGWRELTVWECETDNAEILRTKLSAFLGATALR